MNQTTPKKINSDIKLAINSLGLNEGDACLLKLRKTNGFEPVEKYCHINCIKQQQLHGGTVQFGWVIWQDSVKRFTEAEFHSVWMGDDGKFTDITPRIDGEKRIMFIPDYQRVPEITKEGSLIKNKTYLNHKVLQGNIVEPTSLWEHYLEPDKLAIIGANL